MNRSRSAILLAVPIFLIAVTSLLTVPAVAPPSQDGSYVVGGELSGPGTSSFLTGMATWILIPLAVVLSIMIGLVATKKISFEIVKN